MDADRGEGDRELDSYGAFPLLGFRAVLAGLQRAGSEGKAGDRGRVARRWLESLDAEDRVHCEAAICMAGALSDTRPS